MKIREEMLIGFPNEDITALNLLDYLAQGGSDPEAVRQLAADGIGYVRELRDCSDFRLAYLLRAVLTYKNRLPKDVYEDILRIVASFPYDDCGGHGMCTWTENHRLYIDGSEYLAAGIVEKFADGFSNEYHRMNAEGKLLHELNHIERFGFAEWGSNNYYSETMAALSNIIQFVEKDIVRTQAVKAMDMLLFDICSQTTFNNGYVYNPATARAYVDNKAGTKYGNYLEYQIKMILGERFTCLKEKELCFQLLLDAGPEVYEVPECCRHMLEEVRDGHFDVNAEMTCGHVSVRMRDGIRIVESDQGLDIADYRREGLYSVGSDRAESVRYAMTTGAISDYRLICTNMRYMCETGLIRNDMLGALSKLAHPILYRTGLLSLIKRFVPVIWDSAAQECGRVTTWVFGKYSVSAASDYHVGKPLFQQNPLAINLSHEVSLFVNCPYRTSEKTGSPDYWTGSAVAPAVYADGNSAECIFDLKKRHKGLSFTHLFFPTGQFDNVDISMAGEGLLLGRTFGVNVSVITNPGGHFRPIEESLSQDKSLVTPGKVPQGIYLSEYDFINEDGDYHFYIFDVDDSLNFDDFRTQQVSKFRQNQKVFKSRTKEGVV